MKIAQQSSSSSQSSRKRSRLDQKLAAYLGAAASTAVLANEAEAVVMHSSAVQPIGINGEVNIDFNSDGQTDFQIDHDRVDLGGGNFVDYLQLDKNDQTGASLGESPTAIPDWSMGFPDNGAPPNDWADFSYVVDTPTATAEVRYPSALLLNQEIGPLSTFDFQEGENTHNSGQISRANRLIDEDQDHQVDIQLGGKTPENFYPVLNDPQFAGLNGEVRYLGVKMDLQNSGQVNYGWIGIRITNEDDATGEVVGWGYETELDVSILAGETGIPVTTPGDFNLDGSVDAADYVSWRKTDGANETAYGEWRTNFGAGGSGGGAAGVPEPGSLLLGIFGALAMFGSFLLRRIRRS